MPHVHLHSSEPGGVDVGRGGGGGDRLRDQVPSFVKTMGFPLELPIVQYRLVLCGVVLSGFVVR